MAGVVTQPAGAARHESKPRSNRLPNLAMGYEGLQPHLAMHEINSSSEDLHIATVKGLVRHSITRRLITRPGPDEVSEFVSAGAGWMFLTILVN